MAVDEFLMRYQRSEEAPPILRIYFWDKPSYSIGYFQNVEKAARLCGCHESGRPLVRRITGGGLVSHGKDLTFSLVIKTSNPFLPEEVKASYLKINEAVLAGFRKKYPTLDFADCKTIPSGRGSGERICFESPSCYDLMLNGKKVVGSSQRRTEGVLLHQSSVLLEDLNKEAVRWLTEGFHEKWAVGFVEKPLTPSEWAQVQAIERERYSLADWSFNPSNQAALI